jgi:DNA-binding NarL/FixJ family response regulator
MDKEKKIKIIVADDHPIFRNGLKQIIEEDDGIEIIGVAENGEKALTIINELNPEVAILDIDMPKMTGLQVLKNLKTANSKTKVIFLTVFSSEDIFDESMDLGVSGFVLKDCAVNDIVECIYKVAEDNYYISPSISNLVMNRRERIKKLEHDNPALMKLTKTEQMILKLIAEGKTSKEIANEMFISFKTVENHRSNMSNKLQLKGSLSLIKFAIKNNPIL